MWGVEGGAKPTLNIVIGWIPNARVGQADSPADEDRLFAASVFAEVDRRVGELKSLWIRHPGISETSDDAPPGY